MAVVALQCGAAFCKRAAQGVHRPVAGLYRWLDTPDGGTIVSRGLLVVLCAISGYVAIRLYPHQAPARKVHPGYVDVVLQSRALVLAGRMAILFVAAFAILSIAARMWNKEWLSKAGPFEISRAASHVEEERNILKQDLAKARSTIEDLTIRLKKATEGSDTLARTLSRFIDDQGATDGGD